MRHTQVHYHRAISLRRNRESLNVILPTANIAKGSLSDMTCQKGGLAFLNNLLQWDHVISISRQSR